MRKILLSLLFSLALFSPLQACVLCQLYTPTIDVQIDIQGGGSRTYGAKITWSFSHPFSKELVVRYGDEQGVLSEEALSEIKRLLLAYIAPRDYLSTITHDNSEGLRDMQSLPIAPINPELIFDVEDSRAIFSYIVPFNVELGAKDTLMFAFEDKERFFEFLVSKVNFMWDHEMIWSANPFNNMIFINQIMPKIAASSEQIKHFEHTQSLNIPRQEKQSTEKLEVELTLQSILNAFSVRLKELLERTQKEGIGFSILPLLLFSFLYGALHAAGPGHGKMLVTSYFFGVRQNRAKAAGIALAIGIVHTFSAFLMTLVIYYFFELFFKEFLDNFIFYATKISALIILGISIYLIYKKIPAIKRTFFKSKNTKNFTSFSAHPPTCSCKACSSEGKSTDVGVVLGASLVPCPGTITIFIFTMALGEYLIGFLAAFCMSMGMSLVIFGAASIGRGLKLGIERYTARMILLGELLGVAVMFTLGIALILG